MGHPENSSYIPALVVEGALSGVGILVCSISIILALVLKLYRQLIYRLVLYQVFAALVFGLACILDVVQFFFMKYSNTDNVNLPLCYVDAFIITFSFLAKLFVIVIMTVHIFVFAVCFVNLKRLEVCYVAISLVVPATMAGVPFIGGMYGQQVVGQPWCWILLKNDTIFVIEKLVLLSGPALVSSAIVIPLFVIMLSVLACRAHNINSSGARMNRVAIKQLLPLMVYPTTYCVLLAPMLCHYVYYALFGEPEDDEIFVTIDQVANTSMIWVPGVAFLVHMWVLSVSRKRSPSAPIVSEEDKLVSNNNRAPVRSSTYFSLHTDT